jgi:hypothetical protein
MQKWEPLSPDSSADPSNQRTYYCRNTRSQQPSLLKEYVSIGCLQSAAASQRAAAQITASASRPGSNTAAATRN